MSCPLNREVKKSDPSVRNESQNFDATRRSEYLNSKNHSTFGYLGRLASELSLNLEISTEILSSIQPEILRNGAMKLNSLCKGLGINKRYSPFKKRANARFQSIVS